MNITTPESFADLAFPLAGIDLSRPFSDQRPREVWEGKWAASARSGVNVRGFDTAGRARGGARPGLARYPDAVVVASWVIQDLQQIVIHGSPGGDMQSSSSGRIVYLIAVSQGKVYYTTAGDDAWTEASNSSSSTPPLNFTGIVRSAPNNLKLYFADGTHWRVFDPETQTVSTWAATSGTLPVDEDDNTPRLICTWRGRTVLSGLLLDPHNWFMSKAGDPTNFNYAPSSAAPTDAVAGNNSPLGLIGDVITGLCPYSDDVLIFFGDHSVYMMRGDPMAGGSIDLISDVIGGAWGIPWCKDPYGTVYFVSNQMGIYALVPGDRPVRISQPVEQLLQDVNSGTHTFRLIWNDRFQGMHVFITPTAAAATATHLFWEQRTGAWWQDTFANKNHNPLCCAIFDGNLPDDRVALIGSWDGYVRSVSADAEDDDGEDIESSVVVGPLMTKDLDDVLFKEMQGVLGEDSGDVDFEIFTGNTAEKALTNDPAVSGTWRSGRNPSNLVRRSGHALYVKLSATNPWSFEGARAVIAGKGKVRRRGI